MVNGTPALLFYTGDFLYIAASFTVADGQIHHIHAVLNPDKLVYLRRQLGHNA